MQDFIFWDRGELVEMVRTIEQTEGTGALSVQNPAGGSMTFASIADRARVKLRILRRLSILDSQSSGTHVDYVGNVGGKVIVPVMHPVNLHAGTRRRGPWEA